MTELDQISDLEILVADFRRASVADDATSAVRILMEDVVSDPQSIHDIVPESFPNDMLLYEDESISIWHCRFVPGQTTPPHDHQVTAIIGIYQGTECNDLYEMYSGISLRKTDEIILSAGGVLEMSPSTIHAVSCVSIEPCCGIHVYLGRLTVVERSIFDLDNGCVLPYTEEDYYRIMNAD
ncbi:MAG: hypothetical protein CL398_08655 [Acidiferrobacteraceae bacterium]|nr:hypothetical protein [Acidiferrobacteraceae bacterium]